MVLVSNSEFCNFVIRFVKGVFGCLGLNCIRYVLSNDCGCWFLAGFWWFNGYVVLFDGCRDWSYTQLEKMTAVDIVAIEFETPRTKLDCICTLEPD